MYQASAYLYVYMWIAGTTTHLRGPLRPRQQDLPGRAPRPHLYPGREVVVVVVVAVVVVVVV